MTYVTPRIISSNRQIVLVVDVSARLQASVGDMPRQISSGLNFCFQMNLDWHRTNIFLKCNDEKYSLDIN